MTLAPGVGVATALKGKEITVYEVWGSGMFLIFAEESEVGVTQRAFECFVDRATKTIVIF